MMDFRTGYLDTKPHGQELQMANREGEAEAYRAERGMWMIFESAN